jgi:hypothetical protein
LWNWDRCSSFSVDSDLLVPCPVHQWMGNLLLCTVVSSQFSKTLKQTFRFKYIRLLLHGQASSLAERSEHQLLASERGYARHASFRRPYDFFFVLFLFSSPERHNTQCKGGLHHKPKANFRFISGQSLLRKREGIRIPGMCSWLAVSVIS